MLRRRSLWALTVLAMSLFAGCGGSASSSNSATQGASSGAVVRAADVTAGVPGYRIAATVTVTTPTGPATTMLSGVFDRVQRSGAMTASTSVAGHVVRFEELFSGLTFFLRVPSAPALSAVSHGKPWLKFDMSRMLGSLGLGSLPTTGTDPTQFVDFLRAVSTRTTKLGTATIRGTSTTGYRATVNLDRYPALVPAANRAGAARSISTLEKALGGHMLTMDAWIDGRHLVRRVVFGFPECVAGQHVRFAMTMDVFGYGPQTPPRLPRSDQAFDLTPLLTSTLSKVSFGCH